MSCRGYVVDNLRERVGILQWKDVTLQKSNRLRIHNLKVMNSIYGIDIRSMHLSIPLASCSSLYFIWA